MYFNTLITFALLAIVTSPHVAHAQWYNDRAPEAERTSNGKTALRILYTFTSHDEVATILAEAYFSGDQLQILLGVDDDLQSRGGCVRSQVLPEALTVQRIEHGDDSCL